MSENVPHVRLKYIVVVEVRNILSINYEISPQVSASDIRFDNETADDLQLMEERGMYPPRFIVPIVCPSPTAGPQLARIRFKGAVKDLVFDIPLVLMPTSPSMSFCLLKVLYKIYITNTVQL